MRRAVLFDMDGVITDTERFYVEGLLSVLKHEGIEEDPENLSDLFGSTLDHNCTVLKKKYGLPGTVEEYIAMVLAYRDRAIREIGLLPMPGVLELIGRIRDAGIPMAVASSSHYDTIVENMEKLGIRECFDAIVSGMDCKNSKPDPEIYLTAAKQLGMKPEECVVIEDSHNGLIAGKAAGMYCHAYVPPQACRQDVSMANDILESYEGLTPEDILRN